MLLLPDLRISTLKDPQSDLIASDFPYTFFFAMMSTKSLMKLVLAP